LAAKAAVSREVSEKERTVMGFIEIRAPFNRLRVESAEDLWSRFMEYREHSYSTPIIEPKIFSGKEGPQYGKLEKVRPLTLNGLCNFIGMSPATWNGWKAREQENTEGGSFFLEVLLQIESIIYDDQFQGAAVDIFNASIISRNLGLADKTEVKSAFSVVISQDDAEL
jgi:hypothetical protein